MKYSEARASGKLKKLLVKIYNTLILVDECFPSFIKKQIKLAGWYENPIKSVVTTFPIDKIVFPTITMCPQDSRPDRWGSAIKIFDELNTDCGLQR